MREKIDPFSAESQIISLLNSLKLYEHWDEPKLSQEMCRWISQADQQEVMSVVVAGLWRLLREEQGDTPPEQTHVA